jgi:hypothetical protein
LSTGCDPLLSYVYTPRNLGSLPSDPSGHPPLELAALKNGKAPPELSSDGDPVVLAVDPALQERDRCFRPQPGMELAVWSWHRETADRPLPYPEA